MISTVTLSFDLTYTNPGTGALQPRGVIVDSTDYIGLGLDPIIYELKGLGQITFNGDIIVDGNLISDPIIDLQDWDFVDGGVPTAYFDLPLDLNGNVANGVYTFVYRLRVNSFSIPVAATITPPDLVNVASNQWITQYLEVGNVIRLADPGVDFEDVTVEELTQVGANAEITVSDYTIPLVEIITFDLQNVQLNRVYTYAGCTQVDADVSFTYDCEYGDSGTWGVSNTTALGLNEVVASLSCAINYPSWATLSPTFPGNIVTGTLPYPPIGVETPLATGTYSVSLTQQIQQTQTSGLIVLYTRSVIKEFQVSCAGSLCGLTPCIENLRVAHTAELQRNKISKYQVFVDNVLMYYTEAQNYKACGDLEKYRATVELIRNNLDASGCECACCNDDTYYWVSNNSADSVITNLIRSFQFRLFSLVPAGPGSPLATDDETEGVEVGALWENTDTGIIYRCTSNTADNAVWVEYYAPGVLPTASDVPATPNLPFLSSSNVQNQLSQANTQFAAQLLTNAGFNGDISTIQATLAALDGINGLTRTGDDFLLGGTLTQATTINVDNNIFEFVSDSDPLIIRAGDGAGLTSARAQTANTGVGQNLILETTSTSGNGANGLGSSIFFTAAPSTSPGAFPLSTIQSFWANAATRDSKLTISTVDNGVENIGFTLNENRLITLGAYGTGAFAGLVPAAYDLSVDSSGNVIEVPAVITYAGRTRFSGASIQLAEFFNTTGDTISISNGGVGVYTISNGTALFTTNTTAFIQLQTPGFATLERTSSTTLTLRTYNTAGVANDAVVTGAYVKIEIYP